MKSFIKYQLYLALVFQVCLCSVSLGQVPDSSSTQKPPEGDVVRVTTNLVQVDAVITDKNGKPSPISNLRNYSYSKTTVTEDYPLLIHRHTRCPTLKASRDDNRTPGVPPDRLRPKTCRRTIALVVDDLGLSFQSTNYVRRALKQFVDQQMQAGDLVAIVRTSGGIGALQQFTADKRQLYKAIEHIKWYAGGRMGVGAFVPATPGRFGAQIDDKNKELEEFRNDVFSVGTLGALSYVVKGLSDLPGRKSVLLISYGFKILDRELLSRTGRNDRTFHRLQQLIDQNKPCIGGNPYDQRIGSTSTVAAR
jgi:VWFA-related protein